MTTIGIQEYPEEASWTEPPAHVRRRSGEAPWKRFLLPVASVVVFLTLWQLIGSNLSPIIFATPVKVVAAFIHLTANGEMQSAFGIAMKDFWAGYGLAIVFGILLGTLMGRSRVADRCLNPYVNFFQALPSIAAIPLLVVWFGVGYESRVVTTFWLAVLPVIVNTYTGMRSTPASLREVAKIYHLGELATITRIAFPFALPFIFTGLRRGLGLGLIGMLIAEMEISVKGLGGLIITYGDDLKTAYLLAGICVAAIVGVIGVAALDLVRHYGFPWIDAVAGREQ